MALSVRKKLYLRRLRGYALNPVVRRGRTLLGREQHYVIGGVPVVFPPEHDFPFYQRRDPTYDAYASDLLARIAAGEGRTLVVDLGANVGDTAVAALTASPQIDVVAVEGDPRFVDYLRRNVASFGPRARVVEGFVGPIPGVTTFVRHGSTGGFGAGHGEAYDVSEWVTPGDLLVGSEEYARTVWKSDVDGFDIHLLVGHWDDIAPRCDVLWFEYDPVATLGDCADVGRLCDLLAESGRRLHVYDNLGRPLVELEPGAPVRTGLRSTTDWLHAQRRGHLTVPYLDVWAFKE